VVGARTPPARVKVRAGARAGARHVPPPRPPRQARAPRRGAARQRAAPPEGRAKARAGGRGAGRAVNRLQKLCRDALCVPIRLYKRYISPGLGRNCRFTPTCSEYAIQAIQTHGCVKGLVLAAWRIARCNPLGRWGYDPVPEPGRWTNPRRVLHPPRARKK